MERIETEATINSLTHLESYYQSKYEHYLAMATEAKENRERVGLLLLDLGRDVPYLEDSSSASDLSDGRLHNGSAPHRSLDRERVIQELPQTEPNYERDRPASVVGEERQAQGSVEQMKQWMLDLFKVMSVIESVSNSDSGKALHKNYLHHLLDRELEQKLSVELVELYLGEAVRQGYLELDEFNNNCYIAKQKNDSNSEALESQTLDMATDKVNNRDPLSRRESGKLYDLPESNKLKPTLSETIDRYIEENRPKRFSINDVINYLYPQHTQSDWDKALKNKVRASISNVLGRKAYLGKHWSRIKSGVYRPLI